MKKKLLITFGVLYLGFITYANLRFENPSKKLDPVDLKTFTVESISDIDAFNVKSTLLANSSVRAVCVNTSESTIGVTYKYEELSAPSLLEIIRSAGNFKVQPAHFSPTNKPECPVHGLVAFWETALSIHRFH